MNSNCKVLLFSLAALAVILSPYLIDAKCNSCGDNGIACVNETSFHLCSDGNADRTQIFTCPAGKICSRLSLKCIDDNMGMDPDCSPNKGCDHCDGTNMFTCTSRTTFAQCDGTTLTKNTGVCPNGLTCNSASVEICVNDCNLPEFLECDRAAPL